MAEWQNPQTIAIWLGIAILLVVVLIISIILFTKAYFKRILHEQQKLSNAKVEYQKKLLNDSIIIQERERNRIASDLHDDLISKLYVLKLSHHAKKPVKQLDKMLDHSITIARRISHDLCPPLMEELNLEELITDLACSIQNTLELKFSSQNTYIQKIPTEKKLQIFRISQEVINNILKHANATQLYLNLHISTKGLALMIKDNGTGFDTSQKTTGLGMKNIELRAQLLKGDYRFKSKKNMGSTFLLCITELQNKE